MRVVSSQRSTQAMSSSKSGASARAGAAFVPSFSGAQTQAANDVASLSSLTSISSLLAIQGVDAPDDALTGRKRAVVNARETLDLLDDIKLGLLSGEVPTDKLEGLLERVQHEREGVDDPELNNLLDHIELRARVELAKFGRSV